MRNRILLLCGLLMLLAARSAGAADTAPTVERTHMAMGTEFRFILHGEPGSDPAALNETCDAAFDAIDALEASISNWRPDSNLSVINRDAALRPVKAESSVWQLLLESERLHRETGGVFDPSVGPLLRVWGFYSGKPGPPAEAERSAAMNAVGFDKLQLIRESQEVRFTVPGMALDFGGIGKGQALDRAQAVLQEMGVRNALLSAGTSSVNAIGAPPGAEAWTIGVGSAYTGREQGVAQVALRNESLSTSAAYEHLPQPGEGATSHIFDPRSGLPVDTWLSTAAIAPTGRESDGLSTSFYLMKEAETRAYCERHPDTRAVLVELAEGKPRAIFVNFGE